VKLDEVFVILELFQVDINQASPGGRRMSEMLLSLNCQCPLCRSHRAAEIDEDELPF